MGCCADGDDDDDDGDDDDLNEVFWDELVAVLPSECFHLYKRVSAIYKVTLTPFSHSVNIFHC
jgi:hypothetical protein